MSRVLALKYRPKRFSDLIGQESVSQTISLGLKNDKLSHAYLFSGLRGSGKTSTARIFAKALVCEKAPTDEPCGVCSGCISAEEGRHLDIIEMDAASNRKIEDIRGVIESTKYKPSQAKYKIFIIDEVHMLTKEAFNALLKTLEEPPSYVKFILATTDPIKLPATILSRTIHFRFKKIGHSDVVEHLKHILQKENIPFEEEALEIIARNGSGSLRDTLTLLDQAIVFSKGFVSKASVVELLGAVNPDKIRELFEFILKKDREAAIATVKEFEEYEAENIINEIIEFLKNAIFEKHHAMPLFVLERFFRTAISAKELLFMGADGNFVLTLTVLKMIEAMEIEDIDSLIAKYESQVDFSAAPKMSAVEKKEERQVESKARTDSTLAKTKEAVALKNPDAGQWEKLQALLYERSYELGSAFSSNVSFVSYEDGVLTWSSKAEGEAKELLTKYYSIVKHIVQDVYGIDTKIAVQKEQPKIKEAQEEQPAALMPAGLPNVNGEEVYKGFTPVDDEDEKESEYVQQGPGLFDDENEVTSFEPENSEVKNLEDEAAELSLLKHPLVEKTKEVFGITDSNISVFQKL